MNGDPTQDAALQMRYSQILARIDAACRHSGRAAGSVRLLAVSKTFGADRVLALAALGQSAFGENYAREAIDKMALCPPGLEWHFIGPIQSNKTRQIATHFDWVHSVDREKIAGRLGEQRPDAQGALNCCIQVNVSGEASKSGCAPEAAPVVARAIRAQPRLRLRGVMAIPDPAVSETALREQFALVRAIFESIRDELRATAPQEAATLDTLSIGMSGDFELAIAEGATIVRVGSALFGSRAPLGPSSFRPST
jgi:pyridoxal phosphate enzyme (YggS family)